jgi:hypothetical protein
MIPTKSIPQWHFGCPRKPKEGTLSATEGTKKKLSIPCFLCFPWTSIFMGNHLKAVSQRLVFESGFRHAS